MQSRADDRRAFIDSKEGNVRKLLLFLLMLGFAGNVAGQTLTHPQKVYIDPRDTGGADTLKIDGGLQAGPSGSVQVIAADGSISVSAAVADGTIGKIKFGSDCVAGQILIRNASGSPSYWDCGTASGAGGIQASDNNITITGTGWRFQNATVFGSSTTAQELIHVYNSSGIAGIALQNNLQDWRIRATNNDLQVSNGAVYPLTIKTNQIGLFTTAPASTYELELTGDFKLSGNFYNTGLYTGNIVPGDNSGYQTDKYDIGLPNVKWRNFYAASAVFDQFIQQNVLLYDGYLIVGKSSGKFSGAVSNVATTFISTSSHAVDDFILVRGKDTGGVFQTEYFKILNKSGVGPYTYTVTEASGGRNLDGSGANSWDDGTSYLVLGKLDDGRVEIYANAGIPRLSILSQNSTYSSFTEYVRLGGLDNAGGGGCTDSGRYGILLGLCAGNYLRYQNRTSGGDTDDGILYVKGTIMAGTILAGSTVVQLDASGLDVQNTGRIRGGKPSYGNSTAGFWLGYDSSGTPGYKFDIGNNSNYLRWTGSALEVQGAITSSTISGTTITGGTIQTASSGSRIVIETTPTPTLTWYGPIGGTGTFQLGVLGPAGITVTAQASNLLTASEMGYKLTGPTMVSTDRWGMFGNYNAVSSDYNKTVRVASRWTTADAANVILDSTIGSESATIGTQVVGTNSTVSLTADTFSTTATTHSFGDSSDVILTIDGANNRVGILDTTPEYSLDVAGSVRATGEVFSKPANTTSGYIRLSPGSDTNIGYVAFYEPNTGGSSTGARQGYLGWGLANVNLTLEDSANFTVTGGNVWIPGLVMGNTTSGTGTIITTADTDEPLYINPNGTGRVYFDGTDIEVAGIMLRNWVDGAGQGYACANVDGSADGFITYKTTASCGTSSIRYKTDVEPMDLNGVFAILDLTPVTYRLKALPESKRIMGAIAEQADFLGLEWLIERNVFGQPETLIYDRIGLYLIPVVKQQQERIADLERRIAELEKKKY